MNNARPRIMALLSAAVPMATFAALAAAPLASGTPAAASRAGRTAVAPHDWCNSTAGIVQPRKFPDCAGD